MTSAALPNLPMACPRQRQQHRPGRHFRFRYEVLADFRPHLDAMRRHLERYLTDVPTRQRIEEGHAELLVEHGLEHLDLYEITTSRRVITQTIAAGLFDRGAGGVRFPSRPDGNACVASSTARHGQRGRSGDCAHRPAPAGQRLSAVRLNSNNAD